MKDKRGRARRVQRRANGGGLVNKVKDLVHVAGGAEGIAEAACGVLRFFRKQGVPFCPDTGKMLHEHEIGGRELVTEPVAAGEV